MHGQVMCPFMGCDRSEVRHGSQFTDISMTTFICLDVSIKLSVLIYIRIVFMAILGVRGDLSLFRLSMPRTHMLRKLTVLYFERACQERLHSNIFDRVRMLKPPENARYYKYFVIFCQTLRVRWKTRTDEQRTPWRTADTHAKTYFLACPHFPL